MVSSPQGPSLSTRFTLLLGLLAISSACAPAATGDGSGAAGTGGGASGGVPGTGGGTGMAGTVGTGGAGTGGANPPSG